METNNLHIVYVDEELRCLLDQIADKWTLLVMGLLEQGSKRFTSLRRDLGDVSQKMLTQTLRELERNGIVRGRCTHKFPLASSTR
jgi:DNA-binding HxlR family transcriptional regulator